MSRSPVVLVVEAARDEISAVVGDATGSVLSPEFCGKFVTAFPDPTQDVRLLVDGGEHAFAEVVAWRIHTVPLAAPDGDIAPTGRAIEVPFCIVVRARDGLLCEGVSTTTR
jgi:hypothetical protein